MATARVLDMHLEDLLILVIGHVDRDEVDGILWDPMPGGSGLLQQLVANFPTDHRGCEGNSSAAARRPASTPASTACTRFATPSITSRSTGTLLWSCSRHGVTS
jgi:hypothetical protein